MKDKNKILIATFVLLVIVAIVAFLYFGKSDNSQKNNKVNSTNNIIDTDDDTNLSDETIVVETMEDLVEPGKDTLDITKISGFVPFEENEGESSNGQQPVDVVLSDENLVVESIGGYTGNYLEDGSDEPIKDVAALVVTNKSDKMLQVGDITFNVNDKDKAKFRITNLLPGTSVLVLESNKRKYKKKDNYSFGDVSNAYLDSTSLMEDTFEFIKSDGELTLKNKTNKPYKKVYVYYKYMQLGGAYMGGITYRVPFENIEAKGTSKSLANHFKVNTSKIIDVQVVEK